MVAYIYEYEYEYEFFGHSFVCNSIANKERFISKEMQGVNDILSYKLEYHNIWKITTRSNTLNNNTS